MDDRVIVDQVSGETPALEYYAELKDILGAFGADDRAFDGLPQAAQVFLVGQYMQLRKAEATLAKLMRRLSRLERDAKRLRFQRDHLRDVIAEAGVPERQLAAFESKPMLPVITTRVGPPEAPTRDEEETRGIAVKA